VLAVHLPGRAPYVVLEEHFKQPGDKTDIAGTGLPALVSTTDPNEIEILWDEVPSLGSQVSERISDAFEEQKARMQQATELQRQMSEAAQGGGAATPPVAGVPSAAAVDLLAENAKRTLAYVQDPAMRKMLIEQYRAAGVKIDDEDG
jgi:hypothetical protein